MENQITTGALPLIMGNYASSYGVNLFMYGNSAYTDGKNITIPRLDFFKKEEMEMAYGYVAHECGHIKYSSFKTIEKCEDEIFKQLLNALEDVRIEHRQSRDWPGLARTFSFLVEKLDAETVKAVRKCDNITALMLLYISSYSRNICLNQPTQKSLKSVKRKLTKLAVMPETAFTVLNKLLDTTTGCKTTWDIAELSKKIIELISQVIRDINEKFNEDKSQKEGECGTEQTQQTSNSISKDDYSSFLGDGINEEEIEKMNAEMQKIASSIDSELGEFTLPSTRNPVIPDYASMLEKASKYSKNARDIGSLCTRNSKPADSLELYYSVLKDNSLKCSIQNLARGYELWHQGNNNAGRTLDVRAYANSFCGKTKMLTDKIFKKKVIHKEMNTTVHLLVDTSGSMSRESLSGKTRSRIANHMALSLAIGMEGTRNLNCKVSYFPGNFCEYEDVYQTGQVLVERATYFDQKPRGCTPLAQALLAASSKMETTDKYHRNIIVVITDGEPDNYLFAEQMLNEAKMKGIEVHALRITSRDRPLRPLFDSYIDVTEASELSEALKSLLADKIFSCR